MNEELNWDKILPDIEKGKAVLLLGHGLFPDAHQFLCKEMRQEVGDNLLHFHEKDGLYLFKDGIETKPTAQTIAAQYFETVQPDNGVFKKIAELPFPLIISANPDKCLVDAFAKYRQPYQFDYFSSYTKFKTYPIVEPSQENPLVYNLCGSYEDDQSLLLDYDDLFKLFKNLLADLNIPKDEVRVPLLKTTTYIFLGFHFDRWYTQLFLRYLNMNESQFENKSRNYVLRTSFEDEEIKSFFIRQFNVQYIGGDISDFEELHRRFSARYPDRLRRLVDELSPTATVIVQLIERNDIGAALSKLKSFEAQLSTFDKDLLSQTESIYNHYLQQKKEQTTTQENLINQLNRVRINLRDIAKKLS